MATVLPGVYIEKTAPPTKPLRLDRHCVAGFIGLTEKGPLQEAVKITSFTEFRDIFGEFDKGGILAYSVFGFFNSGGEECYVVRTAHRDGDQGVSKGGYTLLGHTGQSFARFEAKNEGSWGNEIAVKLWYGVEKERVISDYDREKGRWIQWSDESPVKESYLSVFVDGVRQIRKVKRNKTDNISVLSSPLKIDENSEVLSAETLFFNIQLEKGRYREDFLYLETEPESDRYFVKILNLGSKLIHAEAKGKAFPVEVAHSHFSGGKNGILEITAGDFIGEFKGLNDNRGMGIFEAFPEIRIIAAPDAIVFQELLPNARELALKKMHQIQCALISQAERMKDRFALLDTPELDSSLSLMKWASKFDSKFAAMYFPFLEILDPADSQYGRTIKIPPSGHVAGIIASVDRVHGLHHAPANKLIPEAVGLSSYWSDDEMASLYDSRLNPLKQIPGKGVKIWGTRTLASDSQWRFINVVRTFERISSSIRSGSGWAVFEVNDMKLQKRVIRYISAFMIDLWRQGVLAGMTPEEGFFVQCNDELNPVEQKDAGILVVRVGVAISKPAEFIIVKLHAERENANIVIESD